jgi:hypothetical protein
MNQNAQRTLYPETPEAQEGLQALAAAKLAAHRRRRSAPEASTPSAASQGAGPSVSAAAQRVREAVTARYRRTPSYREYLAAEAASAVKKAQAEAEVAARTAKAVADIQTQLLAEMRQWPESEPQPESRHESQPESQPRPESRSNTETPAQTEPMTVAGPPVWNDVPLRVRPFEALPPRTPPAAPEPDTGWVAEEMEACQAEELNELNQEIAFRLDPEFHEHLLEPLPLQANIIEFPRQLVAAKKARPRLAEGPLRGNEPGQAGPVAVAAPNMPQAPPQGLLGSQLRIFEVEPEPATQAAAVPEPVTTVFDLPELGEAAVEDGPARSIDSPEWQRLILDARPEEDEAPSWVSAPAPELPAKMKARLEAQAAGRAEIYPAPLELRLMSSALDGVCIGAASLLFATVAAAVAARELHRLPVVWLGGAAVLLFALLFVLYQCLFFTLGGSTPGMYYADLVFRTPRGDEPTGKALRKRVWANLLAFAPLGMGYLWAAVDSEGLGWHDRLSGTYLREF